MNEDPTTTVSLASIRIEDDYQARAKIDESAIADYVEAIRLAGGWAFPPVKLVSQYVVDGFHRIEAVKRVLADPLTPEELRKSLRNIPCERVPVDLMRDEVPELALIHALAANHSHGVRRTREDKRRSVKLALKQWPDRSSREIAKITFTSNTFVSSMRSGLDANAVAQDPKVSTLTPDAGSGHKPVIPEVSTLTIETQATRGEPNPEAASVESLYSSADDRPPKEPQRPKDHWHILFQALGFANKRLVECMTANGIDEPTYKATQKLLLDADVSLHRLKAQHANEKREEGHD